MNMYIQHLRIAAKEIRAEGHNGWGNACEDGADELEQKQERIDRLEAIEEAARWVVTHVPKEHIAGLVTREHFTALEKALGERK